MVCAYVSIGTGTDEAMDCVADDVLEVSAPQ